MVLKYIPKKKNAEHPVEIIQFKCYFIFLDRIWLIVEADSIYLREIKIYFQ